MLRSQKDVDKHVQEAFRNITNEKERNLRCYNVAKLYHKVGDFQSTKQYVELYLKEQPKAAGAHKLLGQALEALKDYPKALQEYKCSLSLESRQPDLVLKVCELLVETKTRLNAGEAKYWMERAEEVSGNHQAVFRLKEYLIKMEDGSGDQAQLAHLIEKEIEARPHDHVPRIRLLNLYMDSRRVLDAYKYVIDLESRCLFRDNLQWYSYIVEVFKAYQREVKNLDAEFYVNNLCVLERHAALGAREQLKGCSAVYALDQACFEAAKYCQKGGEQLLQECVRHMGGQLCFHLGTALLREGKQCRTGWKEWTPFAWALMSLAYTTPETVDFASHCSTPNGREKHRKLTKLWKEDCAFRCSQAGHIVLNLTLERKRFVQINGGNWRERIYKLLFPSQVKSKPESERTSHFMTNSQFVHVQEISPSLRDVAIHDDASQHQRPDSLHALVWLGLRYVEPTLKQVTSMGNPHVLPHRLSPNFACHVFDELKLSTGALENGGIETLSRLDVDTFLCASVFCAAASQDERYASLVLSEAGRPSVLPVDLMESLCTEAQSKWWSCAHRLHCNKSRSDIGEVRMTVARGLEVVRLLGNHGMDVRLIVLLAKLFTEKASSLSTPKDNIPAVTKRAQLFWQRAIYLLERMEKNQPLRMPENPLFSYGGKELTASDVRLLLEEGRFFMACRLMKEEKYEEAIEVFQGLKNPYASFYEGLMYKKLADAERESLGSEKATTDIKSNYVILLQKSLSALHLTLDRLRSPQNAGNHPLNAELEQHIEEVENCLAREESDAVFSGASRNAHEALLDDSFSSNRFEDSLHGASRIVNTSMHHTLLSTLGYANGQSPSQGLTSTPFKSRRNIESSMNVDVSSRRVEARPSPERLDAQLKRMSITTDTVMQIVVDQNRQMLDSNKTMMEALEKTRVAVEELQKQMSDLKVEVGKLKHSDTRPQSSRNVDYMVHPEEDYEYDVAASQLRSLQGYPSAPAYHSYPAQSYNYDNRSSRSVRLESMLHEALFPQAQVPMARNVDPNLLLASCYPQAALGLNYDRQGPAGVAMPGSLPGALPAPSSMPVPNNMMPAVAADSAADSFRKSTSLMGTPIMSHSNVTAPAIDLSSSGSVTSASQSQFHSAHESSAQRFSSSSVQQVLPGKTNLHPGISGDALPHNFQISMPPQATIPTTESLEKSLSPLKPIAIEAILPNVPMPAYSAVTSRQPDVKPNRLSTGSVGGNETFTEDADYNPCADFKPIIPLPDEVTVTTGEEDETPLFVRRAKLFRFVEKEWKERGVGDMKILKHNVTGKLRILMRREQIHKICANHFILPEMELAPQTGSDRAWSWGANDFSDGEAHIEKLCVRFKTKEDAQDFKEAFDQARKLAKDATPVKQPKLTVPAPKSDVKTPVSQASTSPGKVELGGFSFIQPPVLKPVERQAKTTPGKDKESVNTVSKPSPFAGFSFTPPSSNLFGQSSVSTTAAQPTSVSTKTLFGPVAASSSGSTLFGSKTSSATSVSSSSSGPVFSTSSNLPDFAALAAQNKDKEVGKKDASFKGFEGAGSKVFGGAVSSSSDIAKKGSAEAEGESGETEEFEPTAVFNPVIPLPSLVEVRTGEEGEDVLFEERAKLLRFDSKEWKERGIGKMKVLKNKDTGKVRLLMRREQVLKVCCNHFITSDISFQKLSTSDRALTWSAQDYAEGEVRLEVFALKFKTPDLMLAFKDVVEDVQKNISSSAQSSPATAPKPSGKKDERPLSELFKPKAGSWECSGCFTRNNADVLSCPCCLQPKPGCESKAVESKPAAASQFTFGIKPSSAAPAEESKSLSGFKFGDISTASKEKQPSLAEMFKPKEGSWVCQACYTRSDADKVICPACETPKPGHENDVPSAPSNDANKGFSFGSSSGQNSSTTTTSGFVFGASVNPSQPSFESLASSQPSQPSFGSPHKFEFQMRPASPAKSPGKSPGAPSGEEDSEDEVDEEENADVGDFKVKYCCFCVVSSFSVFFW
ncbi:hypothetical protein ONE63_006950 [Megalurothrips usitatus]|uniref:E3 SUMO-protein ligase RanBP2 n=1 Tax=Megalurothrips usitatus TaxID=439358 RepID=A0AAV7XUL1_9NEOP|nr:hypothetical protein ONE63_006950 [Megalurothrips usitatus]